MPFSHLRETALVNPLTTAVENNSEGGSKYIYFGEESGDRWTVPSPLGVFVALSRAEDREAMWQEREYQLEKADRNDVVGRQARI